MWLFGTSKNGLVKSTQATAKLNDKSQYTLAHLQALYKRLPDESEEINETNREGMVEIIRSIAEMMIWGDKNNDDFFDFFCEKNILSYFIRIIKSHTFSKEIKIQLLQTLSILVQNITTETSIYYLLSNNYVNHLIATPFDFKDEDIIAYYITFLKSLSLNLNSKTVKFFLSRDKRSSNSSPPKLNFPLYTEAIKFFAHHEMMVRTTVRTLTLSIYRVSDPVMRSLLMEDHLTKQHFYEVAAMLEGLTHRLEAASACSKIYDMNSLRDLMDELEEYLLYLQDIFSIDFPELHEKLMEQLMCVSIYPLLGMIALFYWTHVTSSIGPVVPPTPGKYSKHDYQKIKVALMVICQILKNVHFQSFQQHIIALLLLPKLPFHVLKFLMACMHPKPPNISRKNSIKPSPKEMASKCKSAPTTLQPPGTPSDDGLSVISYQSSKDSRGSRPRRNVASYEGIKLWLTMYTHSGQGCTRSDADNPIRGIMLHLVFLNSDDFLTLLMAYILKRIVSNPTLASVYFQLITSPTRVDHLSQFSPTSCSKDSDECAVRSSLSRTMSVFSEPATGLTLKHPQADTAIDPVVTRRGSEMCDTSQGGMIACLDALFQHQTKMRVATVRAICDLIQELYENVRTNNASREQIRNLGRLTFKRASKFLHQIATGPGLDVLLDFFQEPSSANNDVGFTDDLLVRYPVCLVNNTDLKKKTQGDIISKSAINKIIKQTQYMEKNSHHKTKDVTEVIFNTPVLWECFQLTAYFDWAAIKYCTQRYFLIKKMCNTIFDGALPMIPNLNPMATANINEFACGETFDSQTMKRLLCTIVHDTSKN
eukprot:GHVL01023655.1.p1 GENE.GHVL01023655.1~~GHVL01023655.1.p1  ORF type:complete len:820 (-),score=90.91 GHVL01023655.1:1565-4024(-)